MGGIENSGNGENGMGMVGMGIRRNGNDFLGKEGSRNSK